MSVKNIFALYSPDTECILNLPVIACFSVGVHTWVVGGKKPSPTYVVELIKTINVLCIIYLVWSTTRVSGGLLYIMEVS